MADTSPQDQDLIHSFDYINRRIKDELIGWAFGQLLARAIGNGYVVIHVRNHNLDHVDAVFQTKPSADESSRTLQFAPPSVVYEPLQNKS